MTRPMLLPMKEAYARRRAGLRPMLKGGPPRRPHSRREGASGEAWHSPGDSVRQTGIYEVVHERDHRAPHDAVMLSGDVFPACETCMEKVRFRLVRTAPYIFQDEDFEDPSDS